MVEGALEPGDGWLVSACTMMMFREADIGISDSMSQLAVKVVLFSSDTYGSPLFGSLCFSRALCNIKEQTLQLSPRNR